MELQELHSYIQEHQPNICQISVLQNGNELYSAEWNGYQRTDCVHILFYGKSGFVPAKTKGIRYADDPEADYFLIKELTPGFLDGISGTYKDPEGYFVCEKDPKGYEQFEATYPKKEKLKLTGQLF